MAQNLAFALEDGKLDEFHKMLTSFLASIPYTMRRKESERKGNAISNTPSICCSA